MSTGTTERFVSVSAKDEAAKWAARSLSGEMTDEEKAALDEWLNADPRHQESFDAYIETALVATEAADASAEDALFEDLEQFAEKRRSRRRWLAAAPAIAASAAAAAIFFSVTMNSADSPSRYAALHGEMVEINLADGSLVTLNTDTEIDVRVDAQQRTVRLLKGEALFDITRDTKRPFVVASKRAQATVLGTRFNVYEKADETIISVLSGVVEVDAAGSAEMQQPVTLISGREVSVGGAGDRINVRDFDPDAVISWRRGLAYYENEPLAAVVEDLNRYFHRQLVIGDSELNDIPVTGSFDLKDQSAAVEALRLAFSLEVEDQDASRIVFLPDEN